MNRVNKTSTDTEIIAAIKSGNIDLFRVLRERYDDYIRFIVENAIRSRASSVVRNDVSRDTDDLVAEIILKIYNNLDGFDASLANFKTWITHIAENHIIDWLMRTRPDIAPLEMAVSDDEECFEIPLPANTPSPEQRYLASVITDDILTAMRSIENPLLRSHLIFKFLFTLEDSEIASVFGTSESTVRANICRALKEFEVSFKQIKDAYADADMGEIALFIKRDAVEIPDELISDGCGTATKRLRQIFEGFVAGGDSPKPSRELLNELARDALAEILAARKRRAKGVIVKINDKPVSDAMAMALSRYIDDMLSGVAIPEIRGSANTSLIRLKQAVEALASALGRIGVKKHRRASLGGVILGQISESNINFGEAAKILKLDAIELSALINDMPNDKMRSDSKLASRLSAFTGLSKSEVKTLLKSVSPIAFAVTHTRSLHPRPDSSISALNRKIYKALNEKYGHKK